MHFAAATVKLEFDMNQSMATSDRMPAGTTGTGTAGAMDLETQLESISAQVEASVERGRNAWAECRANLADCSSRATRAVDRCVRERTWIAVAAALAGGLLFGAMIRGRST